MFLILLLIFVIEFPVDSSVRTKYVLDKVIKASVRDVALVPAVLSSAKEKYFDIVQFSSVQFSSVQFSSVQFSSVQFSSVLF